MNDKKQNTKTQTGATSVKVVNKSKAENNAKNQTKNTASNEKNCK